MEATYQNYTSWKDILHQERQSEYFKNILKYLEAQKSSGAIIYPPFKQMFNALAYTEFEQVKVIILGQDPYHGPGQAHGLSFSVPQDIPAPPSLINIFKEIKDDLQIAAPKSACLEPWAKQGVLLLNAVLSVEAGKPQSHAKIGWERFTDKIISELSSKKSGLVFMLWGAYAQKKGAIIDRSKHLVLETVHPSPLSAHRGFFGCKHFSKANQYLTAQGKSPIIWAIT